MCSTTTNNQHHRSILQDIAHRAMLERGLLPDSSTAAFTDELDQQGLALDQHAYHNTTSVYTAAETFPMLPEKISTDVTSLDSNTERLAVIIDMVLDVQGDLHESSIYRACNHAKLAYNNLAA